MLLPAARPHQLPKRQPPIPRLPARHPKPRRQPKPLPTQTLETADEKPKEFQPLDEVRDQIRREIAQIKVSEQLESLMGKLAR